MGVYLGSAGCLELRRTSIDEPYFSKIHASDINADKNRFSFDFPVGQFISGDLVQITALDGEPLSFIAPSGWDPDLAPRPIAPPLARIDYANGRVIFFESKPSSSFDNAAIVSQKPNLPPWADGSGTCNSSSGSPFDNSDVDNGVDSICTDAPNYNSPAFDAGITAFDDADLLPRSEIIDETLPSPYGKNMQDDWPTGFTSPEFDPGTVDYDNADVQPRSALGFLTPYHDAKFFIHVDEAGGVKLYREFDLALSGELQGRVDLLPGERTIPIKIVVQNNFERIMAQITNFEVNTEREAVDVTELGDAFREQYSGLISGSGRLSCFFEYERRMCDNMSGVSGGALEMPIYMNQLILRSRIGSQFFAKLTVVGRGLKPGGTTVDFDDEVWYELEGVITNIAMAFEPTQPIRCTVSYVTTGEIKLKTRAISNYILQEQGTGDRLRLEEYQSGYLEQEQEE